MQTNDYLKNSFNQWQALAQAYTDFAVEATQQALKQSLATHERIGQVWAEGVKQAQALSAQEQEVALQVAEAWQSQAQEATRRIAKLFNVLSVN